MLQLSVGARLRVSPFYGPSLAAGLSHVSVYNRMLMPTSYGDPLAEYWCLIERVSLWDVAVERQVQLEGPDAAVLAQLLSARDLSKCWIGQGRYAPICNHDGILINDPVVLRLRDDLFWFSIADSDLLLWAKAVAGERGLNVKVTEPDVSPLAVQGPKANDVVADVVGDWVRDLKLFAFRETEIEGIPVVLARSGWSKQGGFEIYLMDSARGPELWNYFWEAGEPYGIGPGGPNSIERVESGLLSYGADTDDKTTPFEAGMGPFVSLSPDVDYIGKEALMREHNQGPKRQRVGLVIDGPPLPAPSPGKWTVLDGHDDIGFAGSVVYSPRLDQNIAVAQIRTEFAETGQNLSVYAPEGVRDAVVTPLPFI